MDLVVNVLRTVFDKEESEAKALMMRVHEGGSAVIGVMDAAEARARMDRARAQAEVAEMPLRLAAEPAG